MSESRVLRIAEGWQRLLLRLYPVDFREELGEDMVEAYRDRCRAAFRRGGTRSVARVCLTALVDSLRNGPGERVRPAVQWRRGGNWGRDMELVIRRLVRAPLFVATMAGTLALGLGAFAVVATVVHRVLLAPPSYERPDDLYFVWRDYRAFFDLDRGWLGGTDVAALQGAGGVIEDAAGIGSFQPTLTAGAGVDPMEITVLATTANLFDLLGVRAAQGRGFAPGEAGPGRAPVAVLTHGLWQRLGGGADMIGAEIRLNDLPYRIIGVMPADFEFVQHGSLSAPIRPDAFVTVDENLAETNPNEGSWAGLIRVRDGTPPELVAEAVSAVGRRIDERDFDSRGLKLWSIGLHEDLVAPVRPALIVVGLSGVFLVLVLMVNLATLLLARAAQREKEFAVSRALGANQIAIVRATLLEGGVLGALGGAVGVLGAVWATRALVALAPADLPRREFIALDWGMALLVIAVGAVIGLLAATVPAVWAARADLAGLLSNAAVRGGGGAGRMRRGMVVAQIALSLVLLSTGGLLVRSFERLLRADPGFDAQHVLTLRVPVSEQRYPGEGDFVALHERMQAALAAIPGVEAVSAASALPFDAEASQSSITIPGAPGLTGDPERDAPLVDRIGARPGWFEVMGTRLLAGRDFRADAPAGVLEAIIDRNLADHFFPGGSALGATIPWGEQSLTVVGVVAHARHYDVHEDGRPQLYLRASDWGYGTMTWALRSGRSAASLAGEVRAAIRSVDPQLAIADMQPMREVVDASLSQQRVSAVLIGGFALGALLLAAMGLYGVIASTVMRRRHELAVRIALGADHGRVLRMVLGDGGRLILLGLLIGIPGSWMAGRAVRGALVGISATDPLTLVSVAAGLGVVALAACYVPARRVLGIEPSSSLRNDTA
ncbi:MAG TPA: ADOP family duplicated permease [Longimicrobiales bacterium]|nr:ADOP family duplicated permease [Longimicrobiales bacterium]